MTTTSNEQLTPPEKEKLFKTLQERFERNMERHPEVQWADVEKKLRLASEDKISTLQVMEETDGEPDLVADLSNSKTLAFVDCAPESPKGRRSLCYDHQALESRKQHKPKDSAINFAESKGMNILSEEQYARLQQTGAYDNKTSSWLATPEEIRELGGAIFGDRRFGRVFTYHNGAESYYGARGFRGILELYSKRLTLSRQPYIRPSH
ncbi:MAG: DUF4256 domain-containing protein [Sphingobacterium sp.]